MERNAAGLRRRRLLGAIAAGLGVSVAGCQQSSNGGGGDGGDGGGGGGPAGPGDRQYIVGTSSEASSMHPFALGDSATGNRLDLLYDGGFSIDDEKIENGTTPPIDPFWFASWTLSDSADVVEYELRENLQFGGDYGQLTADTYIENIQRVFAAEENWTQYQYYGQFFIGEEPITVEKTGTYSFRAELPEPRANWVHQDPISYVIPVPVEFLDEYGPQENDSPDREGFMQDSELTESVISGNLGPFTLEEWNRSSKMVLARNDDWYYPAVTDTDGVPHFEDATYQVFDEQSTAYSALRAGDITTTSIEARKEPDFQDSSGLELWHSEFGSGIFWLNVNHRINGWGPLRESREVRQALGHLFDKSTLIDEIFNGNANPVDTFTPRWGPYYDDSLEYFVPEPSVEKAKQKLRSGTSSDYGYNGNEEFVGPDGEQVSLTLAIRAGSQSNEIVGNFMQQQLEKVGIDCDVESAEWSNLLSKYFETSVDNNPSYNEDPDWEVSPENGGPWDQAVSEAQWDLAYGLGFSHGAYTPWTVLDLTLAEQGSFNMWGYTTDEYDIAQVARDAASATSRSEAQELLSPLLAYLSRDQPLIWGFNDHSIVGYRDSVANLPEVVNNFTGPDIKRELRFA
jgi:peptide/nickel transport system substrate-binding protein